MSDLKINLHSRYYGDVLSPTITDPEPTGRWKIINVNGESELLIEFCVLYDDSVRLRRYNTKKERLRSEKGQYVVSEPYNVKWFERILEIVGLRDRGTYDVVHSFNRDDITRFATREQATEDAANKNKAIFAEINDECERTINSRVLNLGWYSEKHIDIIQTHVNQCSCED